MSHRTRLCLEIDARNGKFRSGDYRRIVRALEIIDSDRTIPFSSVFKRVKHEFRENDGAGSSG